VDLSKLVLRFLTELIATDLCSDFAVVIFLRSITNVHVSVSLKYILDDMLINAPKLFVLIPQLKEK
jgi:hypothetical protein